MEALHHTYLLAMWNVILSIRSATVYMEGPNTCIEGKQYVSTVMSLVILSNLGYN